MPVNRCVCKNISFAQLIELHEKTGADFDVIARETGCGSACGMCTPYAQAAIVTGKRSLPVSSPAQLMLLMRRAQNSKSRDTSRAM